VKEQYLDAAPNKFVGIDCEYTLAKPGNPKKLPLQKRHRAAVLQVNITKQGPYLPDCACDGGPIGNRGESHKPFSPVVS
jgi:hypothetical protein